MIFLSIFRDIGLKSWFPVLNSHCTVYFKIFKPYKSGNILASSVYVFFPSWQVDCIVSSAGGIEEDFIKCLGHTYVGDFHLKGKELRSKGINRIGNLLVPNDNYCKFEDWLMPILDQMLIEQNTEVQYRVAQN